VTLTDLRNRFEEPRALLTALIDALQKEYETARRRGGSSQIRLFEGTCLSSLQGGYVYRFKMLRLLSHLLSDVAIRVRDLHANVKIFPVEFNLILTAVLVCNFPTFNKVLK